MYEPMSTLGLGAIYEGAGRTTTESTNPPADAAPTKAVAKNTGQAVAGVLGIQLPVLLGLLALAVVAVRFY